MKFRSPESVTLLLVLSSFSSSSSCSFFTFFTGAFSSCLLFLRCPVKLSEQSISSIKMIDLAVVPVNSFRSSLLLLTAVSSRSYTSYPTKLAMAATNVDLPVPGGPYKRIHR